MQPMLLLLQFVMPTSGSRATNRLRYALGGMDPWDEVALAVVDAKSFIVY